MSSPSHGTEALVVEPHHHKLHHAVLCKGTYILNVFLGGSNSAEPLECLGTLPALSWMGK